jgi:starch-binding outer membrane protein, SusD/RagB family
MKKIGFSIIILAGFLIVLNSCTKDLDTLPIDPNITTTATVYDDPDSYIQVLAKIYAGLAVSGQKGPAGMGDISGIDEGFGQYLRAYWYHQVLTTDEAVIGWDDQTIKDFVYHSWGAGDVFVAAMYYRIFYQISIANEYLRETTDAKLNERGVSQALKDNIKIYRAEARFLRALSYWHALDIFGNVPFVTEVDGVGVFLPPQIKQADLFSYIESELLDILDDLLPARSNQYGRADRGAAWMLLAKLYINAEVYLGQGRYADCIEMCNNIINSGYKLEDDYEHLFLADNDNSDEVIFPIVYDGIFTQSYGGTTFIIFAATGGDMDKDFMGIDDSWGGLRTTPSLVNEFSNSDKRRLFHSDGHTLEINDLSEFTNGYAVVKFRNVTSDTATVASNKQFVDTDFPMFRLGDIYLMYAEAHLRGGGGDQATALNYVNDLRSRAGIATWLSSNLNLDNILKERARELYWEGHRRTDLIRFGKFTGGEYVWAWKGNTPEGGASDIKYNLFPIPFSELTANPNLKQNDGYTN